MPRATADYPTREDFIWLGVEQLSEVPEDRENSCPICMMPLVPHDSPTTEDGHEFAPVQDDQDLQGSESSFTANITDTHSDLGIITMGTVHAAGTTVFNIAEQDTLNSLVTHWRVVFSVGRHNLNFDDTEELGDTDEPEEGLFIRIRICRHIFHTACLRKWLSKPMNKTCPLCRRLLFAAPCRHTNLLQDLAALEQHVQHGRRQSVEITRLKEEITTLKKTIKNMEKGYVDFLSDCATMVFVAAMIMVALYGMLKS
ncbi:hypothetical protein DPSP01_005936 [Paraphaeosphaeria sporulosa]|uniref:RING-type domain-containing protein n=1 Tax=Paraphaeosphaeria sporulosa TaxID=1460663 RepID=A0A177CSI8_9PLEO|nr:uncharacterized protein CC84DRAFT_1213613 [Paraphaeosphaeria sporulosa]OAG10266.1 hypothetical protein CC84DRAFT_1213613 [Paraphaeosphaeria sporulosa]